MIWNVRIFYVKLINDQKYWWNMTSDHYCNAQKVQVLCTKTWMSPSADSDAVAFSLGSIPIWLQTKRWRFLLSHYFERHYPFNIHCTLKTSFVNIETKLRQSLNLTFLLCLVRWNPKNPQNELTENRLPNWQQWNKNVIKYKFQHGNKDHMP